MSRPNSAINVLIYSGEGTSVDSVRQTKSLLTGILSPHYAVSTINAQQIIEEPWLPYTALLVFPGGADLPYCKHLNGAGNQKIKQYVRRGGKYLGLCAGGYYGARQIEFEKGTQLEVSGPRELAFYDGTAKGTVFKGFKYGSDEGAHAAKLSFSLNCGSEQETVAYYNGGCLFEGADQKGEVVARYAESVQIECQEPHPAAIVLKPYGEGQVLLSGVHFEYDLDEKATHNRDIPPQVVTQIYEARQSRQQLVEYLLGTKLGLKISEGGSKAIPRLTSLHLTSLPSHTPSVAQFMDFVSPLLDENRTIEDREDKFHLVLATDSNARSVNVINDESGKTIYIHDVGLPAAQETPYFNHAIYFAELASCLEQSTKFDGPKLGALLLYGEVVSSTSTMLERNPRFLRKIPHGLAAVGTQQIAGRGRGSNVWVNPVGVMAVSGVIRIPQNQCRQSPVFIQYLTSLAIVRAINSFLPAGVDIGLRLKWPNDIYIKLDDSGSQSSLAKIGGILVSCNVMDGEFVIVFGSGTNIDNPHPTLSVNSCIAQLGAGPQIQLERLLARFLTVLDGMVKQFLVSGFGVFQKEYQTVWLHQDAQVTLEKYSNAKATVKGISADTGMLVAEDDAGIKYELQPDGNSFDMFRGLIRRKA